jgi:hypothetical protein
MIAWICSFDPEFARQALCPAISIRWPIFCTKLAGTGFAEMRNHINFSSPHRQSQHFVHGLMHIEKGLPYIGPLTQWQEPTFAQHELFGKARDAYSIKVTACHWFTSPVQVYTRRTRVGETEVQVSESCMTFCPSAWEKLLSQSLVVEPQTSQEIPHQKMVFTTQSLIQQLGVDPSEIQAVQLAAPLIPFLRQKRLTEFVWHCSWPFVIECFPPFWLHLQSTAESRESHAPDTISQSSWEIWHKMLQTVRRMSCNILPADKQLQHEALLMATQIEKAFTSIYRTH